MIITVLVGLVFMIINWIISALAIVFPVFPEGFLTTIGTYIQTVIDNGAALFFFVIRPATFFIAIDILFFIYAAEPIYHFVMWVLRKVPFLNIS